MLRVEQSSTTDASKFDAPQSAPVVSPVEKTHIRTTPSEDTLDYVQTDSPDASNLSYVSLSLPDYGPFHSPSSLGSVHPRQENEYMVRANLSGV